MKEKVILLFVCFCVATGMIFVHTTDLCNRNQRRHGKCAENVDGAKSTFWGTAYTTIYLKRRLKYSSLHPASFNPAVSTNKEAHKVFGKMENTSSKVKHNLKRKTPVKVSDYFVKSDQRQTCATSEFKNFAIFIDKSIILI